MTWLDLFTSLDGRISRMPFWICLLALGAIELPAHLLDDKLAAVVGLVLAYPELAVLVKRGHDRNLATWVPALFMAGGVLLDLLTIAGFSGTPDKPSIPFLTIGLPVGVFALILLVELGLRRGVEGPNRFGPDPLQRSA
jgi:uncharacterized membrane protein YhaH (DUF805 family)